MCTAYIGTNHDDERGDIEMTDALPGTYHDHDVTYLGDGEWLLRGFIKGTHTKPNRRRLIARRDSDDRMVIHIVEQVQKGRSNFNSIDPHWIDVDTIAEFACESAEVMNVYISDEQEGEHD